MYTIAIISGHPSCAELSALVVVVTGLQADHDHPSNNPAPTAIAAAIEAKKVQDTVRVRADIIGHARINM